jgi:hypothetical protein
MTKITTKKELKQAQENGVAEIVVVGEVAQKLHRSKKIMKLSAGVLAVLAALLAAAPFSGVFLMAWQC